MIQYFITPRDNSGNRYTLIIDHVNAVYNTDYNPGFISDEFITIPKKALNNIESQLINAGYKWQLYRI